jgi:uncharacterized protein (TIRG00374 family)
MMRWLRVLVTVGLLVLIIRATGDLGSIGGQILELSPVAIVLALVLNTLNRALMAYKWIRLLASRRQFLALGRAIKIYCSSTIWGLLLPATVGADAVRATCTVREGLPTSEVIASIGIERILGGIATPLLAVGALVLLLASGQFDPRLTPIWWISIVTIVVGMAALLISFDGRFHQLLHFQLMGRLQRFKLFQLLEKAHGALRAYRSAHGELAVFFVLTLLENFFPIFITWIIAAGLGIPVSLLHVAAAVPLAYLVARIPFSIGGIGVYETMFVLILSTAGISLEQSIAIALLARVLQIASWLPWWFMYMWEGGRRPKPTVSTAAGH